MSESTDETATKTIPHNKIYYTYYSQGETYPQLERPTIPDALKYDTAFMRYMDEPNKSETPVTIKIHRLINSFEDNINKKGFIECNDGKITHGELRKYGLTNEQIELLKTEVKVLHTEPMEQKSLINKVNV